MEISKDNKMEEKLRQIIQRSLPQEQAEAENIIIHVQSDDDDENETVTKFSNLKLPIVIKPVKPKVYKNKQKNVIIDYQKDIYKSQKNYFKQETSDVGIFEGTSINYVFGFEFCVVDGYVFEYRLCKGKVR